MAPQAVENTDSRLENRASPSPARGMEEKIERRGRAIERGAQFAGPADFATLGGKEKERGNFLFFPQ
jgi:hypothetical protein